MNAKVEDLTLIFDETYRDAISWFRLTVDGEYRGIVRAHGKGNMDGSRALLGMMDRVIAGSGASGKQFTGLIDMREVHSSPLRAQFLIGKWLFRQKKNFSRAAVFGARPWEAKIARAVLKIARFHNVGFFDEEASAREYLGWPDA